MIENLLDNIWDPFLSVPDIPLILQKIDRMLEEESGKEEILPPKSLLFRALNETNPNTIKVVILGQDPYHGINQANGLAFSAPQGEKIPPSLRNIFREIERDLNIPAPTSGELGCWARQGVLLLNTVLSVRKGQARSHRNKGWEPFTDRVVSYVSEVNQGVVFMLWGNDAQEKEKRIDNTKHLILKSVHPSPLSAYRGFIGCSHFSTANRYLESIGKKGINWNVTNQ